MLYPCTSLSVHADDGGSSSLSVQTHRLASRIDALDGMAAHSAGVFLFSCDGQQISALFLITCRTALQWLAKGRPLTT